MGSGFKVQGSGFTVEGSGFRVQVSGFRVLGLGCRERYAHPRHVKWRLTTEDPLWGYPVPALGAVSPFLEPFCDELLSKVDKPGKNDFEIPQRRALRGMYHARRMGLHLFPVLLADF